MKFYFNKRSTKMAQKGGTIEMQDEGGDLALSQKNNQSLQIVQTDFVKFEISDSGLGIPEEKIPYIFNLFESDLMAIHNMN